MRHTSPVDLMFAPLGLAWLRVRFAQLHVCSRLALYLGCAPAVGRNRVSHSNGCISHAKHACFIYPWPHAGRLHFVTRLLLVVAWVSHPNGCISHAKQGCFISPWSHAGRLYSVTRLLLVLARVSHPNGCIWHAKQGCFISPWHTCICTYVYLYVYIYICVYMYMYILPIGCLLSTQYHTVGRYAVS